MSKIKEFPDIGSKLTAPTKKSLFERQKAEAEAKRQREQEETAAVYEDFVKSFDDADDDTNSGLGGRPEGGLAFSRGGLSKRHFSGPPSGPATRGGLGTGRGSSGPGSLGPLPSSTSRKRAFDGTPSTNRDSSQGLFAFDDTAVAPLDARTAFQHSDDEGETTSRNRAHERAPPKPTLHLSSLPPGTSPAVAKSILPPNLHVDKVQILPPTGPGTVERRSMSAIVTLAKETPAIEIDTAVSALQNRYMGWGFYLSLSRHLSSAAVGSGMLGSIGPPSTSLLPFGAKPIPMGPVGGFSRVPAPGSHRGGFAPPSSYGPAAGQGPFGRAPLVQVNVTPPTDLKQLKLIHKTLESLLTHGPAFEALLMSRPDVQKEEKWAWLWDSRSTGGVWYRWRLWDILTGAQQRMKEGTGRNSDSSQFVFEGGATWAAPERVLPFEYTTSIDEFVSDTDYDSSDDEDSGDEGRRRHQHYQGGGPPPEGMLGVIENETQTYLNPLQKAKLVHLLARLPTTNAKLRRGDVARVTAFAIQHAGEGSDEVVNSIVSNVHSPFAFSSANPDRGVEDLMYRADDDAMEDDKKQSLDKEKEDTSPAKLIGLYLISDILSSSSTSGVRHAWRYRTLFEAALTRRNTFAHLGRLDKELSWGRLRAEKWKRSVQSVLSLWEGWCVFPAAAQEALTSAFLNPPLTAKEEAEMKEAERIAAAAAAAGKSKWKTVDEKVGSNMDMDEKLAGQEMVEDDVDGESMEDEDVDGEPMEDDLDGEPMVEDDVEATSNGGKKTKEQPKSPPATAKSAEPLQSSERNLAAGKRRRPRAEDMFADSDGE
jgi:U2-associated protein SR140